MTEGKTIEIDRLIDGQPLRAFHVKLIILTFVVMISDGFDLQSIGYAAPGLVEKWHIDRSAMGPIFTASLVGMLIGAPLLGWFGDRYGRRSALLAGVSVFGTFTLASAVVETQAQLLVLRFLTGLGIGGVAANAVALVAEYAPRRIRTTLIVIAQTGLTIGSMLPAVASGILEESYGWQSQFVVGGVGPLAICVLMVFALPESLKFMVAARRPAAKILRVVNALDPTLKARRDTVFITPDVTGGAEHSQFRQLFSGDLAWITPILWATFVTYLMTNYFLHSWMPILFRGEGLSVHETAVTTAMLDVGGLFGAVTISRLLDKRGVAALLVLFVIACPAVAAIGLIGKSVYLLGGTIFLAGFCTVGITLGMNAVAGVIYPTECRAKGVGWAGGVGRLGSISGPLVGALLIGWHTPVAELFLAPAAALAVGVVLCFVLMRLCVKRYGGHRLSRPETGRFADQAEMPQGNAVAPIGRVSA